MKAYETYTNLKSTIESLTKNHRATTSRLVEMERRLKLVGIDANSEAQDLTAEEMSGTGVFSEDEANAILFALAETGGNLDTVDRFFCYPEQR